MWMEVRNTVLVAVEHSCRSVSNMKRSSKTNWWPNKIRGRKE